MKKHFFTFRKVFTNIACSPLILISNNSELAAKFLPNDVEQEIQKLDTNIKGKKVILLKTFLNFEKCFCIVF